MRHPVADLRLNRLETGSEGELDRSRAGEPTLEGIDDRLRARLRLLPCLRAREDCDADARLWFHVLEEQADELLVVERMPHDEDAFRAFRARAGLRRTAVGAGTLHRCGEIGHSRTGLPGDHPIRTAPARSVRVLDRPLPIPLPAC